MWNSPNKTSEAGKRYEFADLFALVLGLGQLRDYSRQMAMADLVSESILTKLEKSELIFVLYQVFNALLEEVPIPKGGHTGIQEATVAELLSQAHEMVICEMENPDEGDYVRKGIWMSVDRLLVKGDPESTIVPSILKEAGLHPNDPHPYRSPSLTPDLWDYLLLSEAGLFDEFLWDADWRFDGPMDLPPDSAAAVSQSLGLDLDTVQALPHTPTTEELQMAERYLHGLIRKSEMLHPDSGDDRVF